MDTVLKDGGSPTEKRKPGTTAYDLVGQLLLLETRSVAPAVWFHKTTLQKASTGRQGFVETPVFPQYSCIASGTHMTARDPHVAGRGRKGPQLQKVCRAAIGE